MEKFNDDIWKLQAEIDYQRYVEERKREREKKLREQEMSRRKFLNKMVKMGLLAGGVALGVAERKKIFEYGVDLLDKIDEKDVQDKIIKILSHSKIEEMEVSEGHGLWSLYSKSGWSKHPEICVDYCYFEETLKLLNPEKFNENGELKDPLLKYDRVFLTPIYVEKNKENRDKVKEK